MHQQSGVDAEVKRMGGHRSLIRKWLVMMTTDSKFACLTYHAIGDELTQYAISEDRLRNQLEFLSQEGFVIEGVEQLEFRLLANSIFPGKYVLLTVDDGHESALRIADLLESHGCKATFFLTRDKALEKSGYLRPQEIRALRRRGFSLGTHGTTHRNLATLSEQACATELRGSKKWLEDVTGEEVRYMSAPGGFVNRRVLRLAYGFGYKFIGTCRESANSVSTLDLPGTLNRVNVRRHFTLADFQRIVENDFRFFLRRRIRSSLLWLPKQILCR
jgi:peptidoglycan/xylan/chitin deacetylase (PgdA/CDA1 family)